MLKHEDELTDDITKLFSHIINVHHIWLSRLNDRSSESLPWDAQPIDFWIKLAQENYQRTIIFIQNEEHNRAIHYYSDNGSLLQKDTMDIMYHILNHSVHHRAQISILLKTKGIFPPNSEFISYH